MNFLNIVFWNANGLAQHTLEVKNFLSSNQIDILLVSETHFTSKHHFCIPQYDFYHVMHPSGMARGGSGILIKQSIKHHQGTHYSSDIIQATNIIVESMQGPLTVSSIYSPPKHTIKKENYINFFKTLGSKFIACGDYNAKHTIWGSRLNTPKGRQLYWAIKELNLRVISPYSPTYWPSDLNKTPDLIDFCVSKGISAGSEKCFSSHDLSSDHTPVFLSLHAQHIPQDQKCKLHNNKTNWHYFRYLVSKTLHQNLPLKSDQDISYAVDHLVQTIQSASWNSTPKKSFIESYKYPAFIQRKVKEKRKAKKRWQKTKSPENKRKLNKATADLQKLLKCVDNNHIEQEIQNLGPTKSTDYSLWKITKKLKNEPKINYPIRKSGNSWTKSNLEKAYTFANHLYDVFTPNSSEEPPKCLETFLNEPHQLDLPIKKISKAEVSHAIKILKPGKAPGYDLITPKILKELPKEGTDFITFIFNACLKRCFIPPQWKVAQVTMIQKPGKPSDQVKSYRPISLLPIISKVFESLFLKRLMPIIEENNLIPNHQFGFRKNHGTTEQIHRLVETINSAFESKQYCTSAFLDISQAFDKVWHEGLLYKARKLLPINYYLLIKSYIQKRMFFVQEADEMSDLKSVRAGVPQGSVMGPILYILFTSDLPQTENAVVGTFADDTAVLAVNKNPQIASNMLQTYLNTLCEWLKHWRIKPNETKSIHVTFTLNHGNCPPVQMNEVQLPQANEAKYLGLYLDKKLTWKTHIKIKRKACDIQLQKMNFLIGPNSKLSLENKILIYKCIIKPIWTYGIQLWGTASHTTIKLLQQLQSKTLRKIAGAPYYITNKRLHEELNIKTVQEEVLSQLQNYKLRIQQHPNPLATNLMRNTETFKRLKRKAPQDLL